MTFDLILRRRRRRARAARPRVAALPRRGFGRLRRRRRPRDAALARRKLPLLAVRPAGGDPLAQRVETAGGLRFAERHDAATGRRGPLASFRVVPRSSGYRGRGGGPHENGAARGYIEAAWSPPQARAASRAHVSGVFGSARSCRCGCTSRTAEPRSRSPSPDDAAPRTNARRSDGVTRTSRHGAPWPTPSAADRRRRAGRGDAVTI